MIQSHWHGHFCLYCSTFQHSKYRSASQSVGKTSEMATRQLALCYLVRSVISQGILLWDTGNTYSGLENGKRQVVW